MGKLKIAFLFLFMYATAVHAQDSVKISGTIIQPLSDTVFFTYNDSRIAFYPKDFNALLGLSNKFNITIPLPKGVYTQLEMKHGNRVAELIVEPGDSITLTVDTKRFDSSIVYKGRGANIANFIAQHTLAKGRMNQYALRVKEAINNTPNGFLETIAKEKKSEIDFLDAKKKNLPKQFIQYWSAFYEYYNYFFMQQYPQVHEMIAHRRFTDTIPDTNYSVVKKMPLKFNDTLLQLPPYLLYLTGAIETKLKASGYSFYMKDSIKAKQFQDSVYKLVLKKMPDKSAEYYMAQSLYGAIRYQPIERTKQMCNNFITRWPQSSYLPLIQQQMTIVERISPGEPAPDFEIRKENGQPVKLSSLKGHVVYLEFWASWCRQCVSEMLREQKVKDLLKNKPVDFVYVSIGNDTAAEKSLIVKNKLQGIFCDAPGGWSSTTAQQYGVQSLPAYFLIDEEGKFATQTPPSPMQPTQLVLEVGKLLK